MLRLDNVPTRKKSTLQRPEFEPILLTIAYIDNQLPDYL